MIKHMKEAWLIVAENDVGSNDEGYWEWFQVGPARIDYSHRDKQNHDTARANAELIALAPTAPHECDDLKCPGNINRRKLELWDEMKSVLMLYRRDHEEFAPGTIGNVNWRVANEIITKAEAIERGGGKCQNSTHTKPG